MAPEPCPCGGMGCYMPDPVPVSPRVITAAIEGWVESQGVTMTELRCSDRTPEMVDVRRAVAVYLRRHRWSLERIGRYLDRDHTTVRHLLRGREDRPPLEVVAR